MKTAGVDYGVRRVAYACPDSNVFSEYIHPGKDDMDSMNDMSYWLYGVIKDTSPELVVIEHPIQGSSRNVKTGISLAMVAGAFAVTTLRAGSKMEMAWPSTWKKTVIGYGNANKEDIDRWLSVRHPEYHKSCLERKKPQDVIDATCMAIYAKTRLA